MPCLRIHIIVALASVSAFLATFLLLLFLAWGYPLRIALACWHGLKRVAPLHNSQLLLMDGLVNCKLAHLAQRLPFRQPCQRVPSAMATRTAMGLVSASGVTAKRLLPFAHNKGPD